MRNYFGCDYRQIQPCPHCVAEAVVKEWRRSHIEFYSFERFIDRLSHAVECEKRRPILNCDKYKTAEKAR